MTVKGYAFKLTPRQREGRAINAVAELLRRKLSVPNIYLEPPTSLISADVLAVDRSGAGDLHAVEIKIPRLDPVPVKQNSSRMSDTDLQQIARLKILKSARRQLMSMPAHYRYLALPSSSFNMYYGDFVELGVYSEDGIGRLGVIVFSEAETDSTLAASPTTSIVLAPERFRIDPAKLKAIETKLLAKSRPDIEVRI